MCRKLFYLVCVVLVLGLTLTSTASAELVAYWKLDETSGNIAVDSSGNGQDGMLQGDVAWVAGQIGGAWQGNGSNSYIRVPHNESLMINNAISVTMWVYHTATPADQMLCKSDGTGSGWQSNYAIRLDDQGRRINWRGRNNANQSLTSVGSVPQNEWTHIVCMFDISPGFNRIYINGALDSENTSTQPLNPGTGDLFIGADQYPAGTARWPWAGMLDDVRIYDHALNEQEIQDAMAGRGPVYEMAADPIPADEAIDVVRDGVLSWTPGEFANTHDVYFGTVFDDVNDADRTNPLDVLASQGQTASTYDPAGLLEFGQTYYWRVDEVNAPPDFTIFEGGLWQFTVEPFAYPIAGTSITATASSSIAAEEGPENTINGSGLDADDLHSAANTAMWLSNVIGPQPTWIQYEFDQVYKLHQMLVWNYNTSVEPVIGFGIKEAAIEYSTDGANWTTLGTTHEFARGSGADGLPPNTTVDLSGVAAKYVKITANSNWGGIINQYGLSEVRFFYIPVVAREPDPASGSTDMAVDNVTLSWRAGREAASHNLYFSTDQQAVIDETVGAVSIPADSSYANYDTGVLDLAQTYYWKVNEVNEAGTPTKWQGDVLNFTTREFLVVDDIEDYNDFEPDRIFDTWIDGWGVPANGSQVGYADPPFAEQTIVHSSQQSMPLNYDNSTASYSEATANIANLKVDQDWTKHGIRSLSLWFYGDPNNSVTEKLYVKLNGVKVTYDGDAESLMRTAWQPWNINLVDFGVTLSNVTELGIGLERSGAIGGNGVIYLDDIRLYPYSRQLITPVEPNNAGLVAYWMLDEGSGSTAQDSSGNNHHGTIGGTPNWVAGVKGNALAFDGLTNYIDVDGEIVNGTLSLTLWLMARDIPYASGTRAVMHNDAWQAGSLHLHLNTSSLLNFDSNGRTDIPSSTSLSAEQWYQVAYTYNSDTGEAKIYLDGVLDNTASGLGGAMFLGPLNFGAYQNGSRFYNGVMDDIRIYSRVLSYAEAAGLAGRTQPIEKPF